MGERRHSCHKGGRTVKYACERRGKSSAPYVVFTKDIVHSIYTTHLTGSSFTNYPKNSLNDQSFLLIMRASHVIKGASSNLMCQQLREGATNLEQSAAQANELPRDDKASLEAGAEKVKEKYALLKKAVDNYHEFLNKTGI